MLDRDNFVRSWSAPWHDLFLAPNVPRRTHEVQGAGQEKAAASYCEGIRVSCTPLLQAPSGVQSIKEIYQLQLLTAKLSQWKGNGVSCDTPHITEMIQEGLSGGWCSVLTDFGRPCPVLINFFIQKHYFRFPFFPPTILPLLPSLGCCGVIFIFSATLSLAKWTEQALSPGWGRALPSKTMPSCPPTWNALGRHYQKSWAIWYKMRPLNSVWITSIEFSSPNC